MATDPYLFDSPWNENDNAIWLATTLGLQRNMDKYNFPAKLDINKRKQLVSLIQGEIGTISALHAPKLLRGEDTTPLQKEYFYEHYLTIDAFQQAHGGEGFILEETGEFFATLNMENHLHLQMLDCQGEIESAWMRLEKIETEIGKKVGFTYHPRFGFLTADPAESGTALTVSIFLQLPALIHLNGLDEFLLKSGDESIFVSGLQGTLDEIIGDLLVIRNNYTLGLSEEDIISSVRGFATKLLVREKGLRKSINESEHAALKDKVSRSFATLVHSYQIEAIEALDAISLLKLGVDLGWVTGVTIKELNSLFFNCRRAHLMAHAKETISPDALSHKRAEYLHKTLKSAALHI